MTSDQLLAHFERISEAPEALPRLRRFILDLAVRGKLVKPDPHDDSAPNLVKRIQTERISRAENGKRSSVGLLPIQADEVPFKLPTQWALVRLGEALELINGRAFKPTEWSKQGLPIVRIQNLNNPDAPFNYSDATVPEKFHVQTGDFLISWSGTPGTSFGAHIWDRGHALLNQHIFRAELIGGAFLPRFLKFAINSRLLELIDQAHGGVGLQHITKPKLENLPLTLPPLAEQHRIVAKVDELMALCDRLEAAQAERERRRERLTVATFARISNSESQISDSEFLLRHLPRLTTRPVQIAQLRQAILNLAVRGKLVQQDASDENVPTLDGIGPTHVPFLLPASWAWVRVDQVASCRLGKMLDKAKNKGTPRAYLRNVNVRWFDFDLSDILHMRFEDSELEEFSLRRGDVLVCEGGEPGRAAVWDERAHEIYFQKAIHRVRFLGRVNPHYFVSVLRHGAQCGQLATYFTGVGIKHLTGKGLASVLIPLPPIAEQHRIVAKVDELMAICDRLEAQLTTTESDSRQLLEAVLHEALASAA